MIRTIGTRAACRRCLKSKVYYGSRWNEGRSGQASQPGVARHHRRHSGGRRHAFRQWRRAAPQVPRALPGLRPRQRHRAQAEGPGEGAQFHGAREDPGGPAHRGAVPGARRHRRAAWRRQSARHHPPGHPVPRPAQGRPEARHRRDQPRDADHAGRLRRCGAQRHRDAGADRRRSPPHPAGRGEAAVGRTRAADARLSRDLGGWRGHGRGRKRFAVRRHLSAPQVQDRPRRTRGQLGRRADQRPGAGRAVRWRHAHRLQRRDRRRPRHDAQQAEDVSAPGDAGRVRAAAGPAGGRRAR